MYSAFTPPLNARGTWCRSGSAVTDESRVSSVSPSAQQPALCPSRSHALCSPPAPTSLPHHFPPFARAFPSASKHTCVPSIFRNKPSLSYCSYHPISLALSAEKALKELPAHCLQFSPPIISLAPLEPYFQPHFSESLPCSRPSVIPPPWRTSGGFQALQLVFQHPRCLLPSLSPLLGLIIPPVSQAESSVFLR